MLCCIALGVLIFHVHVNVHLLHMCGYIFLFSKPLRLIVLFSDGTDFPSS